MKTQPDFTDSFFPEEADAVNFQQMFSSLSVMFYAVKLKPELKAEYISPTFKNLGYPLEDFYNNPNLLYDIMHPDDLTRVRELNKAVYAREKAETSYEYRVFTTKGETRWLRDQGQPILDENGVSIRWVGVITDITEQKTAQEKLSKTYQTTQAILESVGDLLVVVDDDGIIEMVNDSAVSMLGYEKEEFIGEHIKMLTKKETFLTDDEFSRMVGNRYLLGVEKDFVCKNGTILKVSISSSLRKDHKVGAVIIAKDITQRIENELKLRSYATDLERSNRAIMAAREEIEKSNNKLRQSNRELEDFAYVASHDLQEPLRKVQAFGDRLEKKFSEKLGDEGKDYIDRMRNAAGRMQTLINDLLTFSRIATKSRPFETTNITKIAEGVVSDLEVKIEETKAKVEIENLPIIDADPLQMRQLFQNLIGNALKFQRPGETPHIKISSDISNDKTASFKINGVDYSTHDSGKKLCKIIVQDNGIGFEEKYLHKIFTVFQRLHGRETYEGSGIGLSVCRKIVERHNGEITAHSQPEKGSTFFVTLPFKQSIQEKRNDEI